jgi:SAM-dependent methyltransferase/uncharacterized protein YbaR (Trm112 family)
MDPRIEDVLICPITHERLRALKRDDLAHINGRIAKGELFFYEGRPVSRQVRAGYASADGRFAYAVEDGVIVLLADSALVLEGGKRPVEKGAGLRPEKQAVRDFYERVGWQKGEQGRYLDTIRFTDPRPLVQDYYRRCQLRMGKYLQAQGAYFLDVASGPIPDPGSLALSQDFAFRICVDLSWRALQEAQAKLGEKGTYLLADITNLPIRDDAMDAVLSLHTIYHVPADEQGRAFQELYRVLKPGASAVVVYSWGAQVLPMKVLRALKWILVKGPQEFFAGLRRKIRGPSGPDARPEAEPALYFHAQRRSWFNRSNLDFDFTLLGYQSLNPKLLQTFIRPRLWGGKILNLIFYLEGAFPHLSGRLGQYPMILITK